MPVDPRRPDPVRGGRGPRSADSVAHPRVGGAKGGELSAAVLRAGSGGWSCAETTHVCRRKRARKAGFQPPTGAGAAGHRGEPAARRAGHVGTAVGQPRRNEKGFPGDE